MTAALLKKYNAARNALADARRIDEVKDIRDKAMALELYAYQARDGQLAADATEIKMRATRRVGELMSELREGGQLAKGGDKGGRKPKAGVRRTPANRPATLAEQFVDKAL